LLGAVYFIVLIFIGSFFLLNLTLAVIKTTFTANASKNLIVQKNSIGDEDQVDVNELKVIKRLERAHYKRVRQRREGGASPTFKFNNGRKNSIKSPRLNRKSSLHKDNTFKLDRKKSTINESIVFKDNGIYQGNSNEIVEIPTVVNERNSKRSLGKGNTVKPTIFIKENVVTKETTIQEITDQPTLLNGRHLHRKHLTKKEKLPTLMISSGGFPLRELFMKRLMKINKKNIKNLFLIKERNHQQSQLDPSNRFILKPKNTKTTLHFFGLTNIASAGIKNNRSLKEKSTLLNLRYRKPADDPQIFLEEMSEKVPINIESRDEITLSTLRSSQRHLISEGKDL